MALVKFGGGVVQMSGSIAGNTYARNHYGNYVRARTKPVNPNSARQVAIRSILAELTVRWGQTLTAPQRTAWNLYGSNVAMKNRLGESVFLTGFNHYIRSNVPRLQLVGTPVDDGPVIFELPDKDPSFAIVASEAAQSIDYTFDNTMDWASAAQNFFIKYQGQPQNAQRNFFGGPWRFHGFVHGNAEPPSSPDVQTDPPFAIAEGQHLWCYARIALADGRLSEPFRDDIFVAA